MRDALKIKGQIEIYQNKAKLLEDDSWTKGEEFEKLQADLKEFDEDIRKRLDMIKRDKMNWAADEGVNVDNDFDDEEIGARLTKLQPEDRRQRGGDRGRRGGRSQVRSRRDNNDQE